MFKKNKEKYPSKNKHRSCFELKRSGLCMSRNILPKTIYRQKNKIRKKMLRKIDSLHSEIKNKFDSKIFNRIFEFPKFKQAKRIGIFLNYRYSNIVNTDILIAKSLDRKKIVYVPFDVRRGIILSYKIENLEDLKTVRKNNNLEELKKISNAKKIDLIFTNCLAFDLKNYILGKGFGDRDKFLAKNPFLRKKEIMLAYSFQRIKDFPKNNFDIPASTIITEEMIYKT